MIDDPHTILGVSQNATQDEIKKAYRKKAKQYHPDLHPNDPVASRKMNEINEAYDMLMNPEKYQTKRAQEHQRQSHSTYSQNTYGYQSTQTDRQSYGNPFNGFGFEDFFGFRGEQTVVRPQVLSSDSPTVQRAIYAINSGRWQDAANLLMTVVSVDRDARWYYLSALTNDGLGNTITATQHIEKALQMDPGNHAYQQLNQKFQASRQSYEQHAQGFDMQSVNLQKLCFGFCMMQMCCTGCRC